MDQEEELLPVGCCVVKDMGLEQVQPGAGTEMCVGGTLQTEAVICGKKPRGLTRKQKNSWAVEESLCKGNWKRI